MARDNGGVPAKVYNNVGGGSVERGGGQVGITVDMSMRKGSNPTIQATPKEEDQSKQRGPYGCTTQVGQGADKDMGGVGDNKGTDGPANDFRGTHG